MSRRIVVMIEFDTDADDEELTYTVADLIRRVPNSSVATIAGEWEEAE